MNYSVELLTTLEECDAALKVADDRLYVLEKKESDASYQLTNSTTSATELTAELKGLNKRIEFLTPYLATLEAGDEYNDTKNELRRKTDRRDELTSRQAAKGSVAQLTRVLQQGETAGRVAEVNTFKVAVIARKDALQKV